MARRRDFLVDKKIGSVRSVPYTDWGFLLSAPSKRNPKRDGLGTISTLEGPRHFRRCRGTGELSRGQASNLTAASSTAPCR